MIPSVLGDDESNERTMHLDLPIVTIGSKVLLRFIVDNDNSDSGQKICLRPVSGKNDTGQLWLSLAQSITSADNSSKQHIFLSCTVISMACKNTSPNNITVSIQDSKDFYSNQVRLNRGQVLSVSLLDIYRNDRLINTFPPNGSIVLIQKKAHLLPSNEEIFYFEEFRIEKIETSDSSKLNGKFVWGRPLAKAWSSGSSKGSDIPPMVKLLLKDMIMLRLPPAHSYFPLPALRTFRSPHLEECRTSISSDNIGGSFFRECIQIFRKVAAHTNQRIISVQDHFKKLNLPDGESKVSGDHLAASINHLVRLHGDLYLILSQLINLRAEDGDTTIVRLRSISSNDVDLIENDLKVETINSPPSKQVISSQSNDKNTSDAHPPESIPHKVFDLLADIVELKLVISEAFCEMVSHAPIIYHVSVFNMAGTIEAICHMRHTLLVLVHNVTNHLNIIGCSTSSVSSALKSYIDGIARVDNLLNDLNIKIAESIYSTNEVITIDNVLRQDWDSTSSYMRDKKVTPGIAAMQSNLRSLFFDLCKQCSYGNSRTYSLFTISLTLQCLVHNCVSIIRLYQEVISPSRVRLTQWRIDISYFIITLVDTIECVVQYLNNISLKDYINHLSNENEKSNENNVANSGQVESNFEVDGLQSNTTKIDELLMELDSFFKYLMLMLFLVTDSSDTLLSVVKDLVHKVRSPESVIPTQLIIESPQISLQRTFQCLSFDKCVDIDTLQVPIIQSNRLLDLLYGVGSTANNKCKDIDEEELYRKCFESSKDSKVSFGAVLWKRIVNTSVNFGEVLVAFLFSPTCLSIFEMVMGEEITSDASISDDSSAAINRKRVGRYLHHMLQKRYEVIKSSYPPLTSQQGSLLEEIQLLLNDLL